MNAILNRNIAPLHGRRRREGGRERREGGREERQAWKGEAYFSKKMFTFLCVFYFLSTQMGPSALATLFEKQTPLTPSYIYLTLPPQPSSSLPPSSPHSFTTGCRMYVALFPCNECAKLIIQSGVKDVIYVSDKYHDDAIMIASRRLFDLAGVSNQCFVL